MKSAAIILAAGLSSRMGVFKPLLQLGGQSLLARCINSMRDAGVTTSVVVTGHNGKAVEREAERFSVRCVENRRYRHGMFSSVQAGINVLNGYDAFFVLPVDIPLVRSTTLRALAAHYTPDATVFPTFCGKRGHPPLIPGKFRQKILTADDYGGLAAVLEQHPGKELPVWDRFILHDADTPASFAALARNFSRYDILTIQETRELMAAMPQKVANHCAAVAHLALALETRLRQGSGQDLNRQLLYTAALVHDICKGQPHHAAAGARLLRSHGLPRMAELVGAHCNTTPSDNRQLSEKELLYLADKLLDGTKQISIRQRFQQKLEQYASNKEICRRIHFRLAATEKIRSVWEEQTGENLERYLAERYSNG